MNSLLYYASLWRMDGWKSCFSGLLKANKNKDLLQNQILFYFAHFQHFSFQSKLKIVQLNLSKTINVSFDLSKMKPDKWGIHKVASAWLSVMTSMANLRNNPSFKWFHLLVLLYTFHTFACFHSVVGGPY